MKRRGLLTSIDIDEAAGTPHDVDRGMSISGLLELELTRGLWVILLDDRGLVLRWQSGTSAAQRHGTGCRGFTHAETASPLPRGGWSSKTSSADLR